MYFHKTPGILQWLYPGLLWHMPRNEPSVYLTFDDGPVPECTPYILNTLERYNAQATFFCVGDNVLKHPELFERIIEGGHHVGNHTMNHLNGWSESPTDYLENILECDEIMSAHGIKTDIFRPPYGKMRRSVIRKMAGRRIIMWDVLTGDFDSKLSPQKCLDNTIKSIRPGSVIVFHDNPKASERMYHALPAVLDYLGRQNLKATTL